MDTFSILLCADATPESAGEFVRAIGGTLINEQSGYGSIERGMATVYVGLEAPEQRDWDSLGNVSADIREHVKAVLLMTVSRRSGSKYLAFEIASMAAKRWNGVISWDGLPQWKSEHQQWCQFVERGRVDALPQVD